MNKNETTFRLVNRTSKNFSIIIANFQYAATLLFSIRDRVRLSFIMTLFAGAFSTIRLRRIKLVISQMKLITNITQIINTKTVKLLVTFRQRMKAVVTIYLRNPITFISKARQKLVTIIYEGKLRIVTSPVLVILYTLGYWDVYTLAPLDAKTLGEMDYTVV